jgi:hypothetical protein
MMQGSANPNTPTIPSAVPDRFEQEFSRLSFIAVDWDENGCMVKVSQGPPNRTMTLEAEMLVECMLSYMPVSSLTGQNTSCRGILSRVCYAICGEM